MHKGIVVGKRIESHDVRGWRGRGYEAIICDLGHDYMAVGDLPYRKVFLTGSLTPWSRDSWIEAIEYLKDKAEVYIVLTEQYANIRLEDIKMSRVIDFRKGLIKRRVTRCI